MIVLHSLTDSARTLDLRNVKFFTEVLSVMQKRDKKNLPEFPWNHNSQGIACYSFCFRARFAI